MPLASPAPNHDLPPLWFDHLPRGRSREISSRLEAALRAAARVRSGSVSELGGQGGGGGEEEEEEAGYEGPAFELRVVREAWRCLMLCWDDKVR